MRYVKHFELLCCWKVQYRLTYKFNIFWVFDCWTRHLKTSLRAGGYFSQLKQPLVQIAFSPCFKMFFFPSTSSCWLANVNICLLIPIKPVSRLFPVVSSNYVISPKNHTTTGLVKDRDKRFQLTRCSYVVHVRSSRIFLTWPSSTELSICGGNAPSLHAHKSRCTLARAT